MDRPSKPTQVEPVFRWFLYIGFATSILWAMAVLSTGGPWVAPVFGTFMFGGLSIAVYLRAVDHEHTIRANREHARRQAEQGEGGWGVAGLDQDAGGHIQ